MQYFLAAVPILTLLGLMTLLRWSGLRAGPVSWLVCLAVAGLAFGLTPQVWWVSQVKGLLLSVYLLIVLWTSLLLYNLVQQAGGIEALAQMLERSLGDRSLLLVLIAWAFSGILEGLAGLGLPIAISAPILVGLGISPLTAVAAAAVGHAWSITFGNMGVVFQTLMGLTGLEAAELYPYPALMLGFTCVVCGLAAALILGQGRRWLAVIALGLLMAGVQYGLAAAGLPGLGALGAGLAVIFVSILLRKRSANAHTTENAKTPTARLLAGLGSYGGLAILMTLLSLPGRIHDAAYPLMWRMSFDAVTTRNGFTTPAGYGPVFRLWMHPGTSILITALVSYVVYRLSGLAQAGAMRSAARATWKAAAPTSIGVIATVGLATMMDHCGMSMLLAQGLADSMGAVFPIVSPLVGMLGAFATGSNNNSNVLFVSLQKNVALLLHINPLILIATQTTGGALGSMIAPAKLIVGCSTVNLLGKEGEALRRTLPWGIGIGLLVGLVALALAAVPF
ncbi:MAG: L-lactate permease [Anaerolineae bacterium]|nr:L-lactate permease [Anaerolineae bacterium]